MENCHLLINLYIYILTNYQIKYVFYFIINYNFLIKLIINFLNINN